MTNTETNQKPFNNNGGARYHSKRHGEKAGWKYVTTKVGQNNFSFHYFKNDKHPGVWKKTTMNVSHGFTRISYHIEGTSEPNLRTLDTGWSAAAVAERRPLILNTMAEVKAHPAYKANLSK